MAFSEIIGHQRQMEILWSAMSNGRLHHAYLFLGSEGVGKRMIAIALAKAIHCVEWNQDYCSRCVECVRITNGNHPDVRLIEPLPDKKEIGIQQIRELQRELNYRSFSGKGKIAIIDPAILMNLSAQNALLKTLEEPPVDSLIVLIATNAGALLPTLRSRCLWLSFAPLSSARVTAFLESQYGLQADEAKLLAAMSMGSIGAAENLHKNALIEKRRIWSNMLTSLKVGDYNAAIVAAEALAKNRDEALGFLKWAESWSRDLLIYGATQKSDELVNLDMLPQIEEQATENSVEGILSAFSQTDEAGASIQRNLNRRMVLEKFLFGVVRER
jgi:DNA polymerase-3 subunit delta'